MHVVGLGAWCDYVTEEEYRSQLACWSWPARDIDDALEHFRRGVSFTVQEFATLHDGRRLELGEGRGFTLGARMAGRPGGVDPWASLTLAQLERDVRTTVLPDDDQGEEHPWSWLAACLRGHGIEASPEYLKQLPYEVLFSQRLRAKVTGEREQPPPSS